MQNHTTEKHDEGAEIPCPSCSQVFGSMRALCLHTKNYHNGRKKMCLDYFQCPYCSKIDQVRPPTAQPTDLPPGRYRQTDRQTDRQDRPTRQTHPPQTTNTEPLNYKITLFQEKQCCQRKKKKTRLEQNKLDEEKEAFKMYIEKKIDTILPPKLMEDDIKVVVKLVVKISTVSSLRKYFKFVE